MVEKGTAMPLPLGMERHCHVPGERFRDRIRSYKENGKKTRGRENGWGGRGKEKELYFTSILFAESEKVPLGVNERVWGKGSCCG